MNWQSSFFALLTVAASADEEPPQPPYPWADEIRRVLAPPLKSLLEPLDTWLAGLPAWAGPVSATALFLAAVFWVLLLKREYVYLGAPDQAVWRDLRIWALLVTLPYVVIYWMF